MSDTAAIRTMGSKLAPWHLDVEIAPGLTTKDLNPDSGAPMVPDPGAPIRQYFSYLYPDGLDGRSAFDPACNYGAHLFALKDMGAGRCFGSDVREHWIDQARFLAAHRRKPSDDMEFEVADLYSLPERGLAPFDVGIFAGIFYHLPDPVWGLRLVAELTKEVLFVATATQAGQPDGHLVAVEESTSLALSGVHGLAFYPTGPGVLTRMLNWAGFPAVRCLRWWSPDDSASYLDAVLLMAAREPQLLDRIDRRRRAGDAGAAEHIVQTVRPCATVVVVCPEGRDAPEVPDREVRKFPRPEEPSDPTKTPASGTGALVAQLDSLWAAGAEYLVVPSSAFSWLDDHEEFKSYLDFRYVAPVRDPDRCILYDLKS